MNETLRGVDRARLERSCGRDAIKLGARADGIEWAEAFFTGRPFEPHRHDTYAIGVTLSGVQVFGYRGERRVCLPGQLHFLHPDETHDGGSGTDDGFAYRIVYIEPALIRAALGGRDLPFVADPVQPVTRASAPLAALLRDVDEPIDDLRRVDVSAVVADALTALSGGPAGDGASIDHSAAEAVREYLAAHCTEPTLASTLEAIAGCDRFTIARQFRRAFGTSPDRYRVLRRLALARDEITRGTPLARVAAATGFADQSHLTRQFKRAYGLTPARWAALATAPASPGGRRGASRPR